MDYQKIKKLEGFKDLEQFGLSVLKETISQLLACEVQIFINPEVELKKYDIEILQNPKRGFYPINDDSVIIVGRIFNEEILLSSLGVRIIKNGIKRSAQFLTKLEGALTYTLTTEYQTKFKNCKFRLGQELALHAITNYLSKGAYDSRHIRHLIDFFNRLRTTSFEGEYFSTGLILTKSHFAYNKQNNQHRFGDTFSLKKSISLANTNKVERRFWYLVDGKRTFFMTNKSLVLTQLFVLDDEYQKLNYIDNHTLAKSLKGRDLLFKVENEKLISIINSSSIEISYSENQWKFRDYSFLRITFLNHFKNNEEIVESLLFFIIYCSKNSISSIIWLPKDIAKVDDLVMKKTKNQLIKKPISILNKSFTNHIIRYLSSDGATIFDNHGFLQYFGCIVDISKIKIKGLKGTGESASSALSSNGIAIKISEDGTIKVFLKKNSKALIL